MLVGALLLSLLQGPLTKPRVVRLSCFYIAIGNGKPIHQTIALNEGQGTAVWTNTEEAVPSSRTVQATFLPNAVDIMLYSHPTGDTHYRINRTTLDSEYVAGGGIVRMNGKCALADEAPDRKF